MTNGDIGHPPGSPADPTPLATALVLREVSSLKELVYARLDGVERNQNTFQESITRVPTEVQKAVTSLRELVLETFKTVDAKLHAVDVMVEETKVHRDQITGTVNLQLQHVQKVVTETFKIHDERFRSIDKQFVERDVRSETTSRDAKVAVDAALSAAKEAVGEQNKSSALAISKSESATNKQLDQLALLLQSVAKASDEKISDIKDRLTLIEGRGLGGDAKTATIISIIVAAVAVLGAVFTVITFTNRTAPQIVVDRPIVQAP